MSRRSLSEAKITRCPYAELAVGVLDVAVTRHVAALRIVSVDDRCCRIIRLRLGKVAEHRRVLELRRVLDGVRRRAVCVQRPVSIAVNDDIVVLVRSQAGEFKEQRLAVVADDALCTESAAEDLLGFSVELVRPLLGVHVPEPAAADAESEGDHSSGVRVDELAFLLQPGRRRVAARGSSEPGDGVCRLTLSPGEIVVRRPTRGCRRNLDDLERDRPAHARIFVPLEGCSTDRVTPQRDRPGVVIAVRLTADCEGNTIGRGVLIVSVPPEHGVLEPASRHIGANIEISRRQTQKVDQARFL